jgi:hypothetical protein
VPIEIRLAPDYGCHPLFWDGRDASKVGDIDPSSVPLRPDTIERLDAWAARFDSWLDPDNPGGPPPPAEEVDAFEAEGLELWTRVREELGPGYRVRYKSIKGGALLDPP